MTVIDELFKSLRAKQRRALIPFIGAGDPDLEFTHSLLPQLEAAGADICEIGIPYSDPIADGPVIQASYNRALQGGTTVAGILKTLAQSRPIRKVPSIFMVSYAIVWRRGVEEFLRQAKEAGIAGLLIPDLPAEESGKVGEVCRQLEMSHINLITPTTSRDRALRILQQTTGFVYYVSVVGITGERREISPEIGEHISWLRKETNLPICIGFGISGPDQVKQLAPICDGIIVGSAIMRRIANDNQLPRQQVLQEVREFVATLRKSLDSI